MENLDTLLNELVAKLLTEGSAKFSQNGLNVETTYNDGCFNFKATYESPAVDNLRTQFEEYIKSLNDEFFLEVAETFEDGKLKNIQDKINSKTPALVAEGVNEFMVRLKEVAKAKVAELDKDIKATEKELTDLIEIKDSYIHVINKKF